MDSWLWDPPTYEDEDNFSQVWQPDFCFWHEPDPIENDAANELACIQVLRILITKADTNITELEEEIILIQSQLAWTDETWSELCFIALREKIKFLEMSIKRLKNENPQQEDQQRVDVQLQVHGEPAEKIHEILKSLLEKYSQEEEEQDKSSNVENLRISRFKDEIKLINSIEEVCGAKASGQTIAPSCLEAQKGEDATEDCQNKQNRDAIFPGQLCDSSGVAFEEPNQRDLNKVNAESNRDQGSSDRDLIHKAAKISTPEDVASVAFKEPNQWYLDKINVESNREQGTSDHDLINKAAKISTPENDEQEIAVFRNASGNISSYEADSYSRKWGSCNHSEGINTAVKMPSFANERTIFNSLPKSKEPPKGEPHKLADTIPDGTRDALEQLPNKSIMKPPTEEEDADHANKVDLKRQLVTMGKIGARSLKQKKDDEWLNEGECTTAKSLGGILNKRQETRKPEIKAMTTSQMLEQMWHAEKVAESNFLLRHELEQKACSLPEPQPAEEPSLAMEMELESSSMENLQNRESMIMDKHASDTCANRKSRGQRRDRSPRAAPDPSATSDSQSERKRKHSSICPVNKENKESGQIQTTSGRHKDTAHGMIQKDHQMCNCHTKNEAILDKPLKSTPGSASTDCEPDLALECLPKDTLKKLAKVNNLTGYSKLRKEELVKLLKAKSRDGDWREI